MRAELTGVPVPADVNKFFDYTHRQEDLPRVENGRMGSRPREALAAEHILHHEGTSAAKPQQKFRKYSRYRS